VRIGADSRSETPRLREPDSYEPVAFAKFASDWGWRLGHPAADLGRACRRPPLISDQVEKASVFVESSVEEVLMGDVVIEPVAA
jgi:hypothetical protein